MLRGICFHVHVFYWIKSVATINDNEECKSTNRITITFESMFDSIITFCKIHPTECDIEVQSENV